MKYNIDTNFKFFHLDQLHSGLAIYVGVPGELMSQYSNKDNVIFLGKIKNGIYEPGTIGDTLADKAAIDLNVVIGQRLKCLQIIQTWNPCWMLS